jgi:hypothetical protein
MNIDEVEHAENGGMSLRVCFINADLAISIDNFGVHCNAEMGSVSFPNALRDHGQCLTMKFLVFYI